MCDYCECREQPSIARLSAEHDAVRLLITRMRAEVADGDLGAADSLRDRMAAILVPHTEREERGVYAALRESGVDDAYLARFETDHREIEQLLTAPLTPERATALADRLTDHILREEQDLFPATRQVVAPALWAAVDAVDASPPS